MRIAMIGAGYVGLVSGACFADFGHTSVASTRMRARSTPSTAARSRSSSRALPISSPRTCARSRLSFTTDLAGRGGGAPTRSSSRSARRRGAATATPISPMSTRRRARSPPSSTATRSSSPNRRCRSAPATRSSASSREARPEAEFLRRLEPGIPARRRGDRATSSGPDRIVIGAEDERAAQRDDANSIVRSTSTRRRSCSPSRRTAELIKYAANAFLATKITFINEIADLCEQVGADVQDVARGIGLDNRIGSQVPARRARAMAARASRRTRSALIKTAQDYAAPVRIVETVAAVNDQRKRAMGRKVDRRLRRHRCGARRSPCSA